jgi:hypothetical protein
MLRLVASSDSSRYAAAEAIEVLGPPSEGGASVIFLRRRGEPVPHPSRDPGRAEARDARASAEPILPSGLEPLAAETRPYPAATPPFGGTLASLDSIEDDAPTILDASPPQAMWKAAGPPAPDTRTALPSAVAERVVSPRAAAHEQAVAGASAEAAVVVKVIPAGRALHLTATVLSALAIVAALLSALYLHAVDTRMQRASLPKARTAATPVSPTGSGPETTATPPLDAPRPSPAKTP